MTQQNFQTKNALAQGPTSWILTFDLDLQFLAWYVMTYTQKGKVNSQLVTKISGNKWTDGWNRE